MKTPASIRRGQVLLVCLAMSLSLPAYGVAYCALRDPVNTIYTLFPAADNYRSVVRTIDRDVRKLVASDLPFDLHFNELGRHTVYVAQHGTRPLGLVHARSERGESGMDEFAWALSHDMKIVDVKIQRSRDKHLQSTLDGSRESLVGKSLEQLVQIYKVMPHQSPASRDEAVLRSAIKTLFVTQHVWKDVLLSITAMTVAVEADPNTHSVSAVVDLFDAETTLELAGMQLDQSALFERQSVEAVHMLDRNRQVLGLVIKTPLVIGTPAEHLWWGVTTEGEIRFVGGRAGDEAFASALGYPPDDSESCSSALELSALEIAVLARRHRK